MMRVLLLGLIAMLLMASVALADGCYMPEQAIKKIPEIPAQRAVIAWRDGAETLVVSSALDSESQRLGWIIPLPGVPTEIEKTSPGMIKTLDFCLQPIITHDLTQLVVLTITIVLVANLIMGTFLFKRKYFSLVLTVICILFVLYSLTLAASSSSTGTVNSGLLVEKTVSAGSYEISVLRPEKPDALNAWLAGNGFAALPAEADGTVADYIAEGWVFAAVKLAREEAGRNAPHPLRMTFPAKEAVYPMRLTALAGGDTALELFVIGDKTAGCDVLDTEFCDRFSKTIAEQYGDYEPGEAYHGRSSECEIAHAAACALMWNDCVLTKLSGTLRPAMMDKDIRFAWKPLTAKRQHLYTVQGARQSAVVLFIALMGIWCFVTMIAHYSRIIQPGGARWYFGRELLPVAGIGLVAAIALYLALPKLPAAEVHVSHDILRNWAPRSLHYGIKSLFEEKSDIPKGPPEEIAAWILRHLYDEEGDRPARNRVAGTELRVEDSPGNFTVERRGDKILIRVYDRRGRALLLEYPPPQSLHENAEKPTGIVP